MSTERYTRCPSCNGKLENKQSSIEPFTYQKCLKCKAVVSTIPQQR